MTNTLSGDNLFKNFDQLGKGEKAKYSLYACCTDGKP